MRWAAFFFAVFACASLAHCQPGPPSFCFVLAEDRDALRPLERTLQVVQHYCERVPYVGWNGTWLKPPEALVLEPGALFSDSTERWPVYYPRESMAGSYLIISSGTDTLRIDLPEDQGQLWQQATVRAGGRDTPEVVRFRKGSYAMEHLVVEPWAVRAARVLKERKEKELRRDHERMQREYEVIQRAQARERERAVPVASPPAPTVQEIERGIAQRPGLQKVVIDRVSADTVWVRITGRVLLDGGCASGMPLFGIELRTDTGWVTRHPMWDEQMDCGMPWADWQGQVAMLHPLRWWVGVNSPAGKKELEPGTYRIVLMGANGAKHRTGAFTLR